MINIKIVTKSQRPISVEVSGHAMLADYGKDILCAAVSSTVMMTANGITDILKEPADITVEENKIIVALSQNPSEAAMQFLDTFWLHVKNLKEDYPNNINITISEV